MLLYTEVAIVLEDSRADKTQGSSPLSAMGLLADMKQRVGLFAGGGTKPLLCTGSVLSAAECRQFPSSPSAVSPG
ncbi:hypothetical protein UY3_16839 [Chelonia mydas]|uniref:Uncharacterized protein n=1 Tax=Chelonia mydas TaxID=8469 RepID=M7AT30_CHEMY|nr:hypothetical protein UY3_16839 [Chelonia mydas]